MSQWLLQGLFHLALLLVWVGLTILWGMLLISVGETVKVGLAYQQPQVAEGKRGRAAWQAVAALSGVSILWAALLVDLVGRLGR